MAKPLANGFPIGAIMLKEAVASGMTAGMVYFTYGKTLPYSSDYRYTRDHIWRITPCMCDWTARRGTPFRAGICRASSGDK